MAEWHVTPDYIMDNWTDEQLDLYVEKLIERKKGETRAVQSPGIRKISDIELFKLMGNTIKVIKK